MPSSRPQRVHPSGRLSFRRKVRAPRHENLPLFVPEDTALSWSDLVPEGETRVEIEVGCGKGAFLVEAASTRTEVRFIGVEAGLAYASYCADRLARRGLSNAVMVADDARLFLQDSVPEGSVSRLHVYHPDPWPKRRHRKRRLFGLDFPPLIARCLRPDGELLIATDNSRYFGEILAVLGTEARLRRSPRLEAEYGDEVPGLAFGPTNFAIKYQDENRPRHRAVYVPSGGE